MCVTDWVEELEKENKSEYYSFNWDFILDALWFFTHIDFPLNINYKAFNLITVENYFCFIITTGPC